MVWDRKYECWITPTGPLHFMSKGGRGYSLDKIRQNEKLEEDSWLPPECVDRQGTRFIVIPTAALTEFVDWLRKVQEQAKIGPHGPKCKCKRKPELNRVLIIDKDCVFCDSAKYYKVWMEMNLILIIDQNAQTFSVQKNRWGIDKINLPLHLMETFLFHPEITNAVELEKLT